MKKNKFAILLILLLTITVSFADAGPKPNLQIVVKGLEGHEIVLDLLVDSAGRYETYEATVSEKTDYAKLIDYKDEDGFQPAQLKGSDFYIRGSIHPDLISGKQVFNLGYRLPTEFKIAVLVDKEVLLVTELVTRKEFWSRMNLDFTGVDLTYDQTDVGSIMEKRMLFGYLLSSVGKLILTLIVEGILLNLINKKQEILKRLKFWRFALINLITHASLCTVMYLMPVGTHSLSWLITLIILEMGVVWAEYLMYKKWCQPSGDKSLFKVVLIINASSFGLGLVPVVDVIFQVLVFFIALPFLQFF
ncbi:MULTISPECIES: hypothetical protein [unclassified Fusibacter]|uniref:hypothetical protein n=1 Tax=unclassified Fusibacter TaxID=2624464 RepID=UPI0010107559|nr:MULTISPECIES: hypothetical protein [unclassified Fusibacter]MCK8058364.1 hypothetical protein [Fusibacter sp. A2]NPE20947.1 hypothetical protein [Fusibacter sp. A1]RXV63149.1 hypothetical protein DWB64_03855 [Fusibacter sp. A1]